MNVQGQVQLLLIEVIDTESLCMILPRLDAVVVALGRA